MKFGNLSRCCLTMNAQVNWYPAWAIPSSKYACPTERRGKSGGFRVIYYVQLSDRVILLTIYSKSDETDISIAEIRQLVMEAEQ